MLKAIVHGAMLSLLFVGCAQNLPECKSDEDKITDCVERIYYENGQLKSEIPYKNDKIHGIVKHYREDGRLIDKKLFKNNELIVNRKQHK